MAEAGVTGEAGFSGLKAPARSGCRMFGGGCLWSVCDTACICPVRYEWDERKNRENQHKHDGISLELAALVFEDEHCLIGLERVDESGEQRWHALGTASLGPGIGAVLVVVHLYREDCDGEEIIRIISARRGRKA